MLILAHRGYHARCPENTMAAFEAAVALGCDGIETDVRLTRDGVPVLFHGPLTPLGLPADRLTRSELEAALGHAVPTLDEALPCWPAILWNVEIKGPSDADAFVRILQPYQGSHRLLVTSFDHELAARVAQRLSADCGVLLRKRPSDMGSFLGGWGTYPNLRTLVVRHARVDAPLLDAVRGSGFRIFAYGAITPQEDTKCAALGVDGIITDHPDRSLSVRSR